MIQVDLIEGPRSQRNEDWAALLGVDTCSIEGFSPADFDRVCACGHRSSDDKYATLAKVRYRADVLIEHR